MLPYLRKWPGSQPQPGAAASLPRVSPPPLPAQSAQSAEAGQTAPAAAPVLAAPAPLRLLSLLDIPPVASAIASHLYGHDLRSLRQLNSDFHSLLSARTAELPVQLPAPEQTQLPVPGERRRRPYYHVLLLKSLLCPRRDPVSEPVGVPCKSRGGNVGPCALCERVICSVTPLPPQSSQPRSSSLLPILLLPIAPNPIALHHCSSSLLFNAPFP